MLVNGFRLLPGAFLLALMLAGQSGAYTLGLNHIAYWSVTTNGASTLAVSYNVSSAAALTLIPGSGYGAYINGSRTGAAYNGTIVGAGIIQINVSRGNYVLLVSPLHSSISYNLSLIQAPRGMIEFRTINGAYRRSMTLSNYSNIALNWVTGGPIGIGMPNGYNITPQNSVIYAQHTWTQNRGQYGISFYASRPTNVAFYVNATPTLVNPLNLTNTSRYHPIGVASYGLYNISGRLVPYQIKTDEIYGTAGITAISAYNASPPVNVSAYGASLQLNVAMNVESGTGNRTYWLQNVVEFNTSSGKYSFVDAIWNYSRVYTNVSSGTFTGKGSVLKANQTFYAYSYPEFVRQMFITAYPLAIAPVIKVNYSYGIPVVHFGYMSAGRPFFYDDVMVHIPSNDAYLLVTPYYQAPTGNYYNAELVFCGASSSEVSTFRSLNATVWIYYDDNGRIRQFPSAYAFGEDTGEKATNLQTSQGSTFALVTLGTPNYSRVIYAPGALSNVTTSTTSLTTTTSVKTTYTTTVAAPYNGTRAMNSSTEGSATTGNLVIGSVTILLLLSGFAYALYRAWKFVTSRGRPGKIGARRGRGRIRSQ